MSFQCNGVGGDFDVNDGRQWQQLYRKDVLVRFRSADEEEFL